MTLILDHAAIAQMTATRCCVCYHKLTDAESVEHGIGPRCSRRYYDPLYEPTDQQVRDALGLLAISDLPVHIVDGFIKLVNNDKANARKGSNLLVYWASCNYDNRAEVFKCTAIVRTLGYTDLADKLEIDRTECRVTDNGDGTVTAYVGTKTGFVRDLEKIPGMDKVIGAKIGSKQRWDFPKAKLDHFLCALGIHYYGKLACGDLLPGGVRVWSIERKYWSDLRSLLAPPPPPVPAPQAAPSTPTTPPPANGRVIPADGLALVFEGGWINIYTPYNDPFRTDLKTQVAYRDRKWTGKCWQVKASLIDTLTPLMRHHFGQEFIR